MSFTSMESNGSVCSLFSNFLLEWNMKGYTRQCLNHRLVHITIWEVAAKWPSNFWKFCGLLVKQGIPLIKSRSFLLLDGAISRSTWLPNETPEPIIFKCGWTQIVQMQAMFAIRSLCNSILEFRILHLMFRFAFSHVWLQYFTNSESLSTSEIENPSTISIKHWERTRNSGKFQIQYTHTPTWGEDSDPCHCELQVIEYKTDGRDACQIAKRSFGFC